jgi:hypothetical protein
MIQSNTEQAARLRVSRPKRPYRRFDDKAIRVLDACEPTLAIPGTKQKVEVLRERFLAMQELWHDNDAPIRREKPLDVVVDKYEFDECELDAMASEWCRRVERS